MKKEEREPYIKALLYIAMSDHTLNKDEVDHLIGVGEKMDYHRNLPKT